MSCPMLADVTSNLLTEVNMKSSEKHTPAPWHIGMKPGPMIYGPNGEQVADLSARLVPDSETLGNLALMMAAPNLLDALQGMIEWAELMGTDERNTRLVAARAAVSKATGGKA